RTARREEAKGATTEPYGPIAARERRREHLNYRAGKVGIPTAGDRSYGAARTEFMVQDVHLESLLARIEELRGRFGRASADLDAICSRARSSDFRGVLQNARVVVETLLRSIIHREKGQAPGKDTLEKLIPKLFQEGKQSILPTHIVVHIRTIQ